MAEHYKKGLRLPLLAAACAVSLTGCGDSYDPDPVDEIIITNPEPTGLIAFAPNGEVEADITWTDYGVPYITADNLESLGYGVGYAFARDNICILADQVVKFNSQRARYFGPDRVPGSGDSDNILNDFGYLALGIRENAEQGFDQISERAQALITGYATGYNRYLADTGVENIAPACAGQPWVKPITPIDIMTYAQGVALLPGAANFTAHCF